MRALFEKVSVAPTRSFHVEERRLARFDAPWHFHPEIELTQIIESRGRRFVGDSVETFAAGDLVLLGPNLPHFWHNEEQPHRRTKAHSVVVQFRADFLGQEIWERPEFTALRRLLSRADRGLHFSGPAVRQISDRLRNLPKLDALPALIELLGILHLLTQIRNIRPLASAAYEPSLDRHTEARLARVYAFLMQKFRTQLTLPQIAAIACMTPEAFSRYFKRTTGRNVSVFIAQLRLDHAGRLLRETTHQIGDIAAEAGFATLSSFNRHFLESTGYAPRDYRRIYIERIPPPPNFRPSDPSTA